MHKSLLCTSILMTIAAAGCGGGGGGSSPSGATGVVRPFVTFEQVQAVLGPASRDRFAQLLGTDAGQQSRVDLAAGCGVDDVPCLGLAPLAGPEFLDGVLVGVDLHREPVAGVEELDEPRKRAESRCRRPEQRLAPSLHQLTQSHPAPRALGDHAAVQRVVEARVPAFPHAWHEGDRVRVTTGPLKDVEGTFIQDQPDCGRLIVSVGLLGRGIAIEVDCTSVTPCSFSRN